MSEYQYYEFRAVDRPLSPREMAELRALSTRAEITPTSFTNSYQWGDFKGEPAALVDRYFDAFLYFANWGSRQLMLRVPRRFLDTEAASAYSDGETLLLRVKGDHAVIEFSSENEGGDDYEDEPEEEGHWMTALISLRAELMRGDLRALYLGWLASLRSGGWYDEAGGDEDDPESDDPFEPPVPPGLAKLSAALRTLAGFLRVDDELIEVAAAGSAGEPPAGPSPADLARWIAALPAPEKDAYLLRFLVEEGDLMLRADLANRFREATSARVAPVRDSERRTIRQLLAARNALLESKDRKAADRAAKERVRLDRERAEARGKYLDDLARRESATWHEAEALIASKLAKNYDRAVTLLVDLRDLAQRSNRLAEAEARIRKLRQQHGNKPSLMQRFDSKNLGKPD